MFAKALCPYFLISESFDNKSYGLLLEKLLPIGNIGQCLAIIYSFLYGRYYVTFNVIKLVLVAILFAAPERRVCSHYFSLSLWELSPVIAF